MSTLADQIIKAARMPGLGLHEPGRIFELVNEPVERGYSPPRRSIASQSGAYRRAEKTARVQGRRREGEAVQAIGDEP